MASLAERLGKEVELELLGGEVRLLPSRVSTVISVLPHLLRNAIDHGIEPRGARGDKPERATVSLCFEDTGAVYQITIADDGRGINVERLREKAIAAGLLAVDARPSHEALCGLIFEPKMSTSDEVTDISGRGEGMGAVAEVVSAAGGFIRVESTRGTGTHLVIELPKFPAVPATRKAS